ncbi:MAG TPA: POTRA domain-containing protein, partial [Terriglobales bacterium]|nr:POTRA domain-containing protein [Terriglobales bacterium]
PHHKDASKIKVIIASIEFAANDNLPEELHARLKEDVQKTEIGIDADTPEWNWLDELNEVTAESLMNVGYFHAQARATPFLIRAEPHQRTYALRIDAQAGTLFRLGAVQFENGTVFTEDELRKAARLTAGEPFSFAGTRRAIESISRLYGTKGYIDASIEPVMQVDDEKQQIDLTLKLSEEAQYRVRTLEILGMDDVAKNRLADRLPPGHILDMSLLKSPRGEDDRYIEIRRKTREHTADVVVDMRKKSCDQNVAEAYQP